jgi:hypothetical protein
MKAYQATDSASIALIDRFVVHFGHGLPPGTPPDNLASAPANGSDPGGVGERGCRRRGECLGTDPDDPLLYKTYEGRKFR